MIAFPLLDGLPPAELQALELDGECYRMAEHRVPIGFAPTPALRTIAALAGRHDRLIAGLGTAAWIWGAAPEPPATLEFVVAMDARWKPTPSIRLRVLETTCHPGDVTRVAGRNVTAPLRTAVDLARFGTGTEARFDDATGRSIRELARIGGFTLDEAVTAAAQHGGAVNTHQADARLRAALSPS